MNECYDDFNPNFFFRLLYSFYLYESRRWTCLSLLPFETVLQNIHDLPSFSGVLLCFKTLREIDSNTNIDYDNIDNDDSYDNNSSNDNGNKKNKKQ